jgi:hypothetical protein
MERPIGDVEKGVEKSALVSRKNYQTQALIVAGPSAFRGSNAVNCTTWEESLFEEHLDVLLVWL